MGCEFCGGIGSHNRRCPAYIPEKAKYQCVFCEEGIGYGQDYIENLSGEYAHWDCIYGARELAEWFNIEIQTMYDEE